MVIIASQQRVVNLIYAVSTTKTQKANAQPAPIDTVAANTSDTVIEANAASRFVNDIVRVIVIIFPSLIDCRDIVHYTISLVKY